MARTAIPRVVSTYQGTTTLNSSSAVAVDSMNGMYLDNPGNTTNVFYVLNGTAMTSVNVTVTSVVDEAGRGDSSCDDLTNIAVGAGKTVLFGPFSQDWWNQANETVLV